MSDQSIDPNTHIDAMAARTLPSQVKIAGLGAVALGLVSAIYGFAVAGQAWTWGAILVALVYVLALTQGGIVYAVIMTLTKAHWGRPLKRIAEAFGLFIPVVYALLFLFLMFGTGLYPWNPDTFVDWCGSGPAELCGGVDLAVHAKGFALPTKEMWLSKWVFIGRQMLLIGLLFGLGLFYLRTSLRPDLILAKSRLGDTAPGWWSLIIGGATDAQAAQESGEKTQQALSVILALTYAFVFSFMAYDLMMSLSPWWYANMFGAWTSMSSLWITLAALGIFGLLGRDWLSITPYVNRTVMHDLGKLCLALCMFWGYTTFAQLLPIWYANMPEETDFLLIRLHLPQWAWLAQTVGVMCFVMPFTVLISRGIKKMKWPFIAICAVIMIGIFLERTLVVMPSVHFGDEFPVMNFVIVNIGIWIGALGALFTFVAWILTQLPAIGLTDPRVEVHPWDVHIHSLDAHH
jgi:uncharacterized membrane protein